ERERRGFLPRAGVHVLARVARTHGQLGTVRQLEQQLGAQREVVAVLGITRAAKQVAKQRVVVIGLERETPVDAARQRAVDRALDAPEVALAEGGVELTADLGGRLAGDVVRESTGRVAAEQRPLQPAPHLHTVAVQYRE